MYTGICAVQEARAEWKQIKTLNNIIFLFIAFDRRQRERARDLSTIRKIKIKLQEKKLGTVKNVQTIFLSDQMKLITN